MAKNRKRNLANHKAYMQDWCARNAEKLARQKRDHYVANKPKMLERSRRHRLESYGLTVEKYDELVAAQNGVCAICKTKPDKRLDVDHCHTTGAVRGLLCNSCNRAIGHMHDSPARMVAAAEYLHTSMATQLRELVG